MKGHKVCCYGELTESVLHYLPIPFTLELQTIIYCIYLAKREGIHLQDDLKYVNKAYQFSSKHLDQS